jgi:hypothetical protein
MSGGRAVHLNRLGKAAICQRPLAEIVFRLEAEETLSPELLFIITRPL